VNPIRASEAGDLEFIAVQKQFSEPAACMSLTFSAVAIRDRQRVRQDS